MIEGWNENSKDSSVFTAGCLDMCRLAFHKVVVEELSYELGLKRLGLRDFVWVNQAV